MNKLQPNHRLNDNLTKLQSSDNKMILLNLIRQEHNKSIHHKIENNKFGNFILFSKNKFNSPNNPLLTKPP